MKAIISIPVPPKTQAFKLMVPVGARLLTVGAMPANPVEDQRFFTSWLYDADEENVEYVTLYTVRVAEAFEADSLLYAGPLGHTVSLFMSKIRDSK